MALNPEIIPTREYFLSTRRKKKENPFATFDSTGCFIVAWCVDIVLGTPCTYLSISILT